MEGAVPPVGVGDTALYYSFLAFSNEMQAPLEYESCHSMP